ncbi:hypothetical protein [Mesonia sp. K4-1]|uniref:hypothetical protein n=1 Tax=Mesonia sp. K4-1 TaxID=2602760 RepID=UPI0011CC6666|nr:hypothetical protein [Mesonia sp. K4-1]TXK71902.1 hypothetical protein FT986_15665 [Mesonia sp. K4-1]
MKTLLLLIAIIPTIMVSQNNKQDLYIAYDDCSIHQDIMIENDTLKYQTYSIRFGDKINPEIEYSINENGFVVKHIQMSGKNYPSLSITYLNQNGNNPPIKINQNQIKNKIWTNNIVHSRNTDFISFFENFRNIYLVDFNDKKEEIKIAKKVEIKLLPTL